MNDAPISTNKNRTVQLGVIEGFFGKQWSWESRAAYAKFLQLHQFDFYIYAPKGDKYLRRQWQYNWPADQKANLQDLRETYRAANINFGIGLSPHEIYLNASHDQRSHLHKRIKQINELQPDILCILFDDMRGDIPGLSQIQIDIAHQAANTSHASKIIFCPTYYSFDPVLEKVFGTMPRDYWQTFAKNLDPHIDIFWTGDKVCSANYSSAHLENVTALLGRKPFLWDNYPVNDGAVKSNLLQLRPVDKRHAFLEEKLAGHAVNPMNQAWLSQIPLASLPLAYQLNSAYDPEKILPNLCRNLCGEKIAQELLNDIAQLQDVGLKELSAEAKRDLTTKYGKFSDDRYAQEIIAWLNGEYQFDPACLTE